MKNRYLILVILFFAALFQLNAATFKMASLLPDGSEWHRALQSMASEWQEISDGRVKVKIYPGGIAGGESDVIRKMRIGQIDMAVLSSVGITAILPDTLAMSLPFLLESEEELDYMVEEISPIFDDDILDKGFVVLAWSKSGWLDFFSKEKVIEPEDMMHMKFAGSVTEPALAEAFKKMGFDVISIDTPDVLMGLQSGMVEACYASPMMAASYQWFGIADQMLEINVSPLLGGIVITERAWNRIPDRYKEELIAAARKMAIDFHSEATKIENEAMETMMKNNLTINMPEANTRDNWRALLGEDFSALVGGDDGIISTEAYKKVSEMLQEFRSR